MIAYTSRLLHQHEKNYTIHDLVMVAKIFVATWFLVLSLQKSFIIEIEELRVAQKDNNL